MSLANKQNTRLSLANKKAQNLSLASIYACLKSLQTSDVTCLSQYFFLCIIILFRRFLLHTWLVLSDNVCLYIG